MARPTKYKKEYDEQVYKLCLLGTTDKQIADFFNINEDTVNEWKKKHKGFSESIKRGKDQADAEIAKALFHRAKGYSHPDVHIGNYKGTPVITDITKHYPPDATSIIFWLKNRQPDKWRDKQEHTHKGDSENPINHSHKVIFEDYSEGDNPEV